jgi:hypothetical protein
MLDVHPPHGPTHTWKDFFIHIATIVVGLLIAVGLEQTVEHFHQRHELTKLREDLRAEIGVDRNLTALQIELIHQVQAELRADMALLLAHRVTGKPLEGKLRFEWTFRRFNSAAWKANRESGAVTLMPHAELRHYEYIFEAGEIAMTSAREWMTQIEIARAIAERAADGALSPEDTSELITAISATQGKLAQTERLVTFVRGPLDDHDYDH